MIGPQDDHEESETTDIDNAGEMILLEKVGVMMRAGQRHRVYSKPLLPPLSAQDARCGLR